ncbi:MAG: hypothetical protein OZ929_01585 [Bryobacterales bacterium]|nr:hypothetical protein [Bryobacterales bacterium]
MDAHQAQTVIDEETIQPFTLASSTPLVLEPNNDLPARPDLTKQTAIAQTRSSVLRVHLPAALKTIAAEG